MAGSWAYLDSHPDTVQCGSNDVSPQVLQCSGQSEDRKENMEYLSQTQTI